MENEENINYDTEYFEDPEEENNGQLSLDQKLQNTIQSLKPETDTYTKYRLAESFVKKCLIPEGLSESDAESYIKYKLAKEFELSGREGNKVVTDLKNMYKTIVDLNIKKARATAVQKPTEKILKPVTSDIVNDIIMPWESYVYPYDYSIKNGKLVKTVEQLNYKTMETETMDKDVSYTPFILCGRTAPEQDKPQYYTIRYELNGSYGEFVAQMSDLLDINTMQRVLTGHGINVPANQKLDTNEYIGAFIHQLGHSLKATAAINQNGFNEDFSLFAMGSIGVTKEGVVPISSLIDTEKHIKPFKQKGKFECWVQGASGPLAFPKPRFLFYHGMSSALIRILGVEQDIIDVTGNTSTGKTGSLAIVSSALGNPSTKPDGYAFEVGDSYNPLMAHAAGLRDMPVVFEEATGKARREAVIKAAYNIANGVEKTRAQKNGKVRNDVLEVRSNVLISCEQPISEEIKTAGGKQRVKDLPTVLPQTIENGEMINNTKKIIFENYGFFFPLYIQKIMNDIPRVKALHDKALTKITNNFSDLPEESKATANRSRYVFASKLVAGYLCEEIFAEIGIPSKTEEETEELVNAMYKECVLDKPVESDSFRALKYLCDVIEAKRNKFYQVQFKLNGREITEQSSTNSEFLGNVSPHEIRILGKAFHDIMTEGGFTASTVASDLQTWKIAEYKQIRVGPTDCQVNKKGYVINISAMNKRLGIVAEENDYADVGEVTEDKIILLITALTRIKKAASKKELEYIFGSTIDEELKVLLHKRNIYLREDGKYTTKM